MYDIIAMIWFLRDFHCKFVSKKKGKRIPSVSFCHGGSALMMKRSKQAMDKTR
jgi:1-acyl-sn-glycerol-3-phosphate acyltransferase